MRRILVTGGLGFIGSRLVRALVNEVDDVGSVIALDNLSSETAKENLDEVRKLNDVKVVTGEISDGVLVNHLLDEGIDTLVHLAAISRIKDSLNDMKASFDVNVSSTGKLLGTAVEHKVQKFIFASSLYVFGDAIYLPVDETHPKNPKNPYAHTKLLGEEMCKWFSKFYNLNTAIARFFMVYGPRDYGRFIPIVIQRIMQKQEITINGGEQILDYIYVDDVVSALTLLIRKPDTNGDFNIGTGLGTRLADLVTKIGNMVGEEPRINVAPARRIDSKLLVANSDKARQQLGFIPKYSVNEGLRLTVDWYMKNYATSDRTLSKLSA